MPPLLSLVLAAATAGAPAGPPQYSESLSCAAYSQAAAELSKDLAAGWPDGRDPATGLTDGQTFDHAMFWSFAVMDAARREGVTAADAEAAQTVERAKAKPALTAGDAAARAALKVCLGLVPR